MHFQPVDHAVEDVGVDGRIRRTNRVRCRAQNEDFAVELGQVLMGRLPELGLDLDVAQEHLAGHDRQGAARQEEQQAQCQGQRDGPV